MISHCPRCRTEISAEQGRSCPHCGYRMSPENYSFIPCVKFALRRGLSLRGRATRAEYWWFMLFCMLPGLLGSFWTSLHTSLNIHDSSAVSCTFLFIIPLLAGVPMFCLSVRRLHDTGRSACAAVLNYALSLLTTIALLTIGGTLVFTNIQQAIHLATASPLYNILALISTVFGWYVTIITLIDSQRGPNKYGPSAKYPTSTPPSEDTACTDPLPCIAAALRGYCTFRGRATRAEFWWFFLFTIVAFNMVHILSYEITAIIFGFYDSIDMTQPRFFPFLLRGPIMEQCPILAYTLLFLPLLPILALFLPSWAVTVRRLHDIRFSGAIAYITFPAGLFFLIFSVMILYNILTFFFLVFGTIGGAIFIPCAIFCLICGLKKSKPAPSISAPAPLSPKN